MGIESAAHHPGPLLARRRGVSELELGGAWDVVLPLTGVDLPIGAVLARIHRLTLVPRGLADAQMPSYLGR